MRGFFLLSRSDNRERSDREGFGSVAPEQASAKWSTKSTIAPAC